MLSAVFQGISRYSCDDLTTPTGKFTEGGEVSYRLSFAGSAALLDTFNVISMGGFTVSPAAFPAMSFAVFRTFAATTLTSSFITAGPAVTTADMTAGMVVGVVKLTTVIVLADFYVTFDTASTTMDPYVTIAAPLVVSTALGATGPTPVTTGGLTVISP